MKQLSYLVLLLYCTVSLKSMNPQKSIQHNPCKPNFIQQLQKERDELKNSLQDYNRLLLSSPYYNSRKRTRLEYIFLYAYDQNYSRLTSITEADTYSLIFNNKKYSVLSIAALTHYKKPLSQQNEFIRKLLILNYNPTSDDRNIAFIERWERISWNKIILLLCAKNHQDGNISTELPYKIIQLITWFMFTTEKSLF
ncbi:MAG TPA: hypothetical protein VLB80_04660 [Candidatus Babeliales bacterium]|nr:hypothetical protein [Candidatus Babeliales bacterium]